MFKIRKLYNPNLFIDLEIHELGNLNDGIEMQKESISPRSSPTRYAQAYFPCLS